MMLRNAPYVRDAGVVGSNPVTPTIFSAISDNINKWLWRTLGALLLWITPLPVHADAIGNAIVSAVVNAMQKSDSSPSDNDGDD